MNFVSIDVETASADMSSICQIGIAKYIDGELVDQWESLIVFQVHRSGILLLRRTKRPVRPTGWGHLECQSLAQDVKMLRHPR